MPAGHLVPNGKWIVDYDDYRCVLNRPMLLNGKKASFSLQRVPLSNISWLKVAADEDGPRRKDGENGVIGIDGKIFGETFHYNYYRDGQATVREYMLDLDKQPIASTQKVARLWIPHGGDIDVDLEGLPKAAKALDACMDELKTELGIAGFDPASLKSEPDVPVDFEHLIITSEGVHLAFLLWVEADGRIDRCKLLLPSGQPAFDSAFCAGMEKHKGTPAENLAGTPVAAPVFFEGTIRRNRMR